MITTEEYLKLYNKYPNPDCDDPWHEHYEGEQEDFDKIVEYNKALLEKYPWLEPSNAWSGKKITDCSGEDGEEGFWPGSPTSHPDYHYEYTKMDDMPAGWRLAFGDQMLEELQSELEKFDYVDKYEILQIKEKYGGLRWYTGATPIGKLGPVDKEITRTWKDKPKTKWDEEVWEFEVVVGTEKDKEPLYTFKHRPVLEQCNIRKIESKYEELSEKICVKCGKPAKWISKGWVCPWCDDCKEDIYDEMVDINDWFSK